MSEVVYTPMALFCFCREGLGVGCDLFRLHLTVRNVADDLTFSSWTMDAPGSGLSGISVSGGQTYDEDIPLEWANLGMVLSYNSSRTLLSSNAGKASVSVTVYAELACEDGTKIPTIAGISGGDDCTCTDADGERGFTTMQSGNVGTILYRSSPLGDCNGCLISTGGVIVVDDPANVIDARDTEFCICATGGSVLYTDDGSSITFPKKYFIESGHLAGGQSLNEDSGCISGTADPRHPASAHITFTVLDVYSGERVSTTCGITTTGCTGSEGVSTPNNYTYAQ